MLNSNQKRNRKKNRLKKCQVSINKFQKIRFYHAYFWNLLFFEICCFLKFVVFWDLLFFSFVVFLKFDFFLNFDVFWNLLFFSFVVVSEMCCFLKCDILEICSFSNLLLVWPTPICCHQVVVAYFLQYFKGRHIEVSNYSI